MAHPDKHYVKIWGYLVVLLIISLIGPELGIRWVMLITAFGIAVVKAWMVVKYFMHIEQEKAYIAQLMIVMLALMLVFVAGVAPDINQHEGRNWVNDAALREIARAEAEAAAGGDHHGDEGTAHDEPSHGDDHAEHSHGHDDAEHSHGDDHATTSHGDDRSLVGSDGITRKLSATGERLAIQPGESVDALSAHASPYPDNVLPTADVVEVEDAVADAGTEAKEAPKAAADGGTTYAQFCASCHGTNGGGDGPAGAVLTPTPADFTSADFWAEPEHDDAYIIKVITEGGAAVGASPLMAPWGGVLSAEQIVAVAEHLKTFK